MDNGSQMSPSAGEDSSQNLLFCSPPKSNTEISHGHIGNTLTEVETNKGGEGQKEGCLEIRQL